MGKRGAIASTTPAQPALRKLRQTKWKASECRLAAIVLPFDSVLNSHLTLDGWLRSHRAYYELVSTPLMMISSLGKKMRLERKIK